MVFHPDQEECPDREQSNQWDWAGGAGTRTNATGHYVELALGPINFHFWINFSLASLFRRDGYYIIRSPKK